MITFFAKAGVIATAIAGVIAISGATISGIVYHWRKRKMQTPAQTAK